MGVSTTGHANRTTTTLGTRRNSANTFTLQFANAFTTGTSANRYQLTEVSVRFGGAKLGNPAPLQIAIHDDNGGIPGTMLPDAMITLGSTSPQGVHTATFSAPVMIMPRTTYFVVFSVPMPTAALNVGDRHQYQLQQASTTETASPGWSIAGNAFSQSNDNNWSTFGSTSRLSFGVTATTTDAQLSIPTTIPNIEAMAGTPVTLTLPQATYTGSGTLTYTLTETDGSNVAGFDAVTRIYARTYDSGTAAFMSPLIYTVTDGTDTVSSDVLLVVTAIPQLTLPDIPALSGTVGIDFTHELPEATTFRGDGTGATYSLTLAGETDPLAGFNPATRVFTGNPTIAGTTMLSYSVMEGLVTDSRTIALVVTADKAPQNVRAERLAGTAGVKLTWEVPTIQVGDVDKFFIYRDEEQIAEAVLNAVEYTDMTAVPTLQYTYSVGLINLFGDPPFQSKSVTVAALTQSTVTITTSETAQVNSMITLSATVNDPDNTLDIVRYVWTLTPLTMVTVDGVALAIPTTATLSNTADPAPTFNTIGLPIDTILTFNLTVNGSVMANAKTITLNGSGAAKEQVTAVVAEVARAIVSSTVNAVTNRISDVASAGGGVNVAGAQFAGVNIGGVNVGGLGLNDANMASALQTNAQAFATNSDAMKTLLGNSDFSLPLNAAGDRNDGSGFGSVGIWASGEYSDLSGESDDLDWDGELTGFHLGIDGKIRTSGDKNILIGVALSSLNGDLDYKNETATGNPEKGNYEIDMTTVSPYIGWRAGEVDLWASVGFGEGEVELTDDAMPNTTHKSDAEQTSFAIGGSVADMVVNKNYSVKLKGELSASEFEIDDSDDDTDGITEQTVDATRARISVEASRISDLENGRAFEKSAEIGARFDGGDGETGAGVEIGGKLKYHAANGFTAEGSARILLGHSGDYQEWGIQGTIAKQVRRDGQGLAFHLTPAYGDVNSSVSQLLAQGLTDDANNTANPDYHMNLTTRLGYGIAYRGMVTPYTEMVLGTSDEYRMGINWKPNQTFNLTLLGKQSNQNTIRLTGAINF